MEKPQIVVTLSRDEWNKHVQEQEARESENNWLGIILFIILAFAVVLLFSSRLNSNSSISQTNTNFEGEAIRPMTAREIELGKASTICNARQWDNKKCPDMINFNGKEYRCIGEFPNCSIDYSQ